MTNGRPGAPSTVRRAGRCRTLALPLALVITRTSALLVAAGLAASFATAVAPAEAATPSNAGTYHALTPTRIGDSRTGAGLPKAHLAAGQTFSLPVLGQGGVPATGVSSVVVNITVAHATSTGYLSAYASGTTQPRSSTINYPAGWTGATTATVAVGADGSIALGGQAGETDVIVDVVGYYSSAADTGPQGAFLVPTSPQRVADTRPTGRLGAGQSLTIGVPYDDTSGQTPTAVTINLTALSAYGPAWLTAWSGNGTMPTASSVNVAVGETSPNQVVVPLRKVAAGRYAFTISNPSAHATHFIADLVGLYATDTIGSGYVYVPVTPTRVLDTRNGTGGYASSFGPGVRRSVPLPASIVPPSSIAVTGTITATAASDTTYFNQWAYDPTLLSDPAPQASVLNVAPKASRANGFTTFLGPAGIQVRNAHGTVHVVEDITGRFDLSS